MRIAPPSQPLPLLATRGKLVRPPWTRWFWAVTAFLLAVLGVLGVTEIAPRTATPLRAAGTLGWIFPQDGEHASYASAAGGSQVTVPVRSGAPQGVYFDVYNPSDLSQTIVGLQPDMYLPGRLGRVQVGVSGATYYAGNSADAVFADHVSIAPHQTRWVRLTWQSTTCEVAARSSVIATVRLVVKVRSVERNESIHLPIAFGVDGPSNPPPGDGVVSCG
jgi:hypothetical protein